MTSEYAGVVYDLDGTLVDLVVDWDAVARDVQAVYADAGISPDDSDLWTMLGGAREHGLYDDVEAAIAAHEREGARESRLLPHADVLAREDRPVAVCSLNCEAACRVALDTHDLAGHVGPVVGRDTVSTWKPDPEPLLHAVDGLGLSPENVLFVGDSERDAVTADRAGTGFEWVE
ncbi:HAD family hydrolase [Haloarchaeobius salinus]|uniref:HAD family hydrolase n=1 Tax=Haloarchaeobius salinus TaxID=1198298 RepID=UPI00210A0F35|nr:HAD hydrolase-like protein [Haloarchaeobius salinus]